MFNAIYARIKLRLINIHIPRHQMPLKVGKSILNNWNSQDTMKVAIIGEEISYPECEPQARRNSRLESFLWRSSRLPFTTAFHDYGKEKKNERRRERERTRNNINLKLGRWNFARCHLIFFEFHRARKRRCASRVAVSTSLGTPLSRHSSTRLDSEKARG